MTAGAGGDASKRISHTVGGRVKMNNHLTITLEVSLQTKNSLRKVGVFIYSVCVRARAFVCFFCVYWWWCFHLFWDYLYNWVKSESNSNYAQLFIVDSIFHEYLWSFTLWTVLHELWLFSIIRYRLYVSLGHLSRGQPSKKLQFGWQVTVSFFTVVSMFF